MGDVGGKREGTITKQLKVLAQESARLQDTVNCLRKCLKPVLSDSSPSVTGEEMERCNSAPMVQIIEELQIEVITSRKILQDILERLEL